MLLLFSTAYNTSLIYCFVIWCLHTNKRRPCSSTVSGHPSSSWWGGTRVGNGAMKHPLTRPLKMNSSPKSPSVKCGITETLKGKQKLRVLLLEVTTCFSAHCQLFLKSKANTASYLKRESNPGLQDAQHPRRSDAPMQTPMLFRHPHDAFW